MLEGQSGGPHGRDKLMRRPGQVLAVPRRALAAAALTATALAVIWSLAAAGLATGTGAELTNDLALVAAAFTLAAGWARGGLQGAINALVVEHCVSDPGS